MTQNTSRTKKIMGKKTVEVIVIRERLCET